MKQPNACPICGELYRRHADYRCDDQPAMTLSDRNEQAADDARDELEQENDQ